MKVGKGVVKKYSREYHRTLKNGEKKKYTTEQIQITVPKNEDIYNNKEEVLIIPQSEIEEFYNLEKELEDIKIANYLLLNGVENVDDNIGDDTSAEYRVTIRELKSELESIKQENEDLKNEYLNIKRENETLKSTTNTLQSKNNDIKDSYTKISEKYNQLKQENLNTKTSYAEIYEVNANLEKDYDNLRIDYNNLVDKYNNLEEELYKLKNNRQHNEYIVNKFKEFILKNEN